VARLYDLNLAERQPSAVESQLDVALDNMPGALVYTDADLNIVVCNDRFRKCTGCQRSCCSPAVPIQTFCARLQTRAGRIAARPDQSA
jgi:PAS domain-containing protein